MCLHLSLDGRGRLRKHPGEDGSANFASTAQLCAFALAAFLACSSAFAQSGAGPAAPRLDPQTVLERSEAALGRTLDAHTLTVSTGRTFTLVDYRGHPLVISLIYTSCSSVCPTTTEHLAQAVKQARKALGDESFAVLSVGFDARRVAR
ncbi:SCO family protein [Microvirga massiliensis]|uniref:SCO family protein n=1 Tax=Microvirga massiliensis TaxID=1033741 RepID=UPI00069A1F4A|nr:SCO family protein [Microvirga massiliensis]